MGIEPTLVTVRSKHRDNSLFLKPIYCDPVPLYRLFADRGFQRPFCVQSAEHAYGGSLFSCKGSSNISGAVFDIREALTAADLHQSTSEQHDIESTPIRLLERIPTQLARIRVSGDESLRKVCTALQEGPCSYCLVLGRVEPYKSQNGGVQRFSHIAAVYFRLDTALKRPSEDTLQKLLEDANALFSAIDLIAHLDSAIFKTAGLAMVAKLNPLFYDRTVAPADKIAFAIEKLKLLLSEHLIGIDYTNDSDGNLGAPIVIFDETKFNRHHTDENQLAPVFQIYPQTYRNESPIGSFLAAHPRTPSIAKYLLNRYFQTHEVIYEHYMGSLPNGRDRKEPDPRRKFLTEEFRKVFTDGIDAEPHPERLRVEMRQFEADYERCAFHELTMSSVYPTEKLWGFLNKDVVDDKNQKPGKSIVAFIVEGETLPGKKVGQEETRRRRLPRGILTIESPLEDAFSDGDIYCLRTVVSGLATLIRGIRHPNSPLDYEYAIRDTFILDAQGIEVDAGGGERIFLGEYLFHMIRMDAKVFETIVTREGDERIRKVSGFTTEELRKLGSLHEKILKGLEDVETYAKEQGVISVSINHELRKRRETFISQATELKSAYEALGAQKVRSFFEACPSNYVWAAYLESTAEVLGGRVNESDPKFDRIGPGFSAGALLMAAINGELHQIVKLSTKTKLKAEHTSYKRNVRYKIPFAARLPESAFAFDSKGEYGKEMAHKLRNHDEWTLHYPADKDHDSYGALVSDLVDGSRKTDGKHHIATSLSLTSDHVKETEVLPKARSEREAILSSIQDHFCIGVRLWCDLSDDQLSEWKRRFDTPGHPFQFALAIKGCYRLEAKSLEERANVGCVNSAGRNVAEKPLVDLANILGHHLNAQRRSSHGDRSIPQFSRFGDFIDYAVRWLRELQADDQRVDPREYEAKPMVIHGDMNARNLAWAASFQRFFIIDFEHTSSGLRGIDQWRLIYSLLVDSYFEAMTELSSHGAPARRRRAATVAERIENAVFFVSDVIECMDPALGNRFLANMGKYDTDFTPGGNNFLIAMLAAILSTVASKEKIDVRESFGKLHEQSWNREPWRMMAICAALKELDYSMRDPNAAGLETLGNVLTRLADSHKRAEVDRTTTRETLPGPCAILTEFENEYGKMVLDERRYVARIVFSIYAVLASIPVEAGVNVH